MEGGKKRWGWREGRREGGNKGLREEEGSEGGSKGEGGERWREGGMEGGRVRREEG